jgi:cell division septum initiation protein DivIVA
VNITWIILIVVFLTSLTSASAAIACVPNDASQAMAPGGTDGYGYNGHSNGGGYGQQYSWPYANQSMGNQGIVGPGMTIGQGMNPTGYYGGYGNNQWHPGQAMQNSTADTQENDAQIKCFKVMPNGELVPVHPKAAADQHDTLASQKKANQIALQRKLAAQKKKALLACMAKQKSAEVMEQVKQKASAVLEEAKKKAEQHLLAAQQETADTPKINENDTVARNLNGDEVGTTPNDTSTILDDTGGAVYDKMILDDIDVADDYSKIPDDSTEILDENEDLEEQDDYYSEIPDEIEDLEEQDEEQQEAAELTFVAQKKAAAIPNSKKKVKSGVAIVYTDDIAVKQTSTTTPEGVKIVYAD